MLTRTEIPVLADALKMEKGKRRRRTTPEELELLEAVFQDNPLPDTQRRKQLAVEMNMDPRSVQIWFQNRRQKEKAKTVSKTSEPSTSEACKHVATGKENIPPKSYEYRPRAPPLLRTQSEPAATFLSSAAIRSAASSRRSLARTRSHLAPPASSEELVERMPLDSSSPIKAHDAPQLRRSTSFTLEWAASQASVFRPEASEPSRQPSKQLRIADYLNDEVPPSERQPHKRHRLSGLSISLSNPSPFLRAPIEIVEPPASYAGSSLDELIHAAKALHHTTLSAPGSPLSNPESGDSLTDEEMSVAAKRRGGDESYSSIEDDALDLDAAEDERDQRCASLLLGLCAQAA